MNNIVILTTIFKQPEKIVDDYFESLLNQSFKLFDVILIDDGCDNISEKICKYKSLNIKVFEGTGSIPKNRSLMIEKAITQGYEKLIFCDFDDAQSTNRVEIATELLSKYDLIVNDVTPFNSSGVIERNVLSKRFVNGSRITLDEILDFNFIGFSNSAINASVVDFLDFSFPDELIAVDWYFFSRILLKNISSVFTSEATTFYRQHETNIIGIGNFNEQVFKNTLKVKRVHYIALASCSLFFSEKLIRIESLQRLVDLKDPYIDKLIEFNKRQQSTLLWWELREEIYEVDKR